MKRLLAVFFAALALPAAAQAKEINALAVCGADACEDVDMAGFGHRDPIAGDSATADGPPPSDFLRIDFTVDGQVGAFTVFYEPNSGLVAIESRPGTVEWARLEPRIATAVKDAAKRLEPFPAPRVTGVRVGEEAVQGDPGSYLGLLTLEGEYVLPKTSRDAKGIRFETLDPNPWTAVTVLYYPEDDVIFRRGTFVKLPVGLAADIRAARGLGTGGGTTVPWLPIGVALAGAALLVALFVRTRTARRRALVVASLLALAFPAGAGAKGLTGASLCGPEECRDLALTGFGSQEPFDMSDTRSAPAPGPYYELRLEFEHGGESRGIYYEPKSRLVAYSESYGNTAWAPLVRPPLDTDGLEPYPTPTITAAWVGDRRVTGDPASYLRLFGLDGPFVVPSTRAHLTWIRLDSPMANPWTQNPIAYYPDDDVVLAGRSSYVRVPASVAAAVESARSLDSGGSVTPWIALGTGIAVAVALLLLRTLGPWSGSWQRSSSSTSSGRRSWRPGKTRRSSAAA
jgi:hypothetical protein